MTLDLSEPLWAMGRIATIFITSLKKLIRNIDRLEKELPGTKFAASLLVGYVVFAFISKPKDVSVYKMPTKELINKYYGTPYKDDSPENEEEKIYDTTINSSKTKYPFGRVG